VASVKTNGINIVAYLKIPPHPTLSPRGEDEKMRDENEGQGNTNT
jgi:hypothetical protein